MDGSLIGGDAYDVFIGGTSQKQEGEKFVGVSDVNTYDCICNLGGLDDQEKR